VVLFLFLVHLAVGIVITLAFVSREAGVKFFRFNTGLAAMLLGAALAVRPPHAAPTAIGRFALVALVVVEAALLLSWATIGRALASIRPAIAATAVAAGVAAIVGQAVALTLDRAITVQVLTVASFLSSAGLLGGGLRPEEVARAVRRTRARVVHAHNLNPSFGWRALAAARALMASPRARAMPAPRALHLAALLDHLAGRLSGREAADGRLADELVSKGVPEEEADYYQGQQEAGRSIVLVESYGHQQEARDILHRYGAYDASTHAPQAESDRVIPVREEVLQAHKQLVVTGEIVIRKKVITEEKTITVPITREELVIDPSFSANPAQGRR